MIVWLISLNDTLTLPVACLNTLRECSEWLQVPLETLKTALKRHGIYKSKKYVLERVQIDE